MKLLLALAGVAMVLGGEVQNLRGEPKAVKEEVPEAAPKAAEAGGEVGAVAKEPAEAKAAITKEEQSEEVPKAAGDVVTEPTESKAEASAAAQELESRTETEETEEPEVGVVFEELDEKSGDEVKEKSAHRPGRRRPWHGPGRRRPVGGGCTRYVNCYNGWYGGVRCSGGRHCGLALSPRAHAAADGHALHPGLTM